MPNRPCTMNDVARRAGVHPATVSRALRGDPRITPAVRATVNRTARELDYRPNPLVAALMSARRAGRIAAYQATIAYVTKYPAERATRFARDFGQLLVGARERAQAQGYQVEEFNLHDPSLTPRRATEILRSRNIHGLLIAPLHSVREPVEVHWPEFSTVAVGYSLSPLAVSRVAHNHSSGLALAARQCREAGWRRLGLALQRRVHEKVEKRWVAATLLDQSEQPPPDRVPPLLLDEPGEERFVLWFRRHRPEVVLTVDAPTVIGWLKRLGHAVPRDVSVVALDRRPHDRGLAGIDQDYANLGANAVDMLIAMTQRNERGLPAKPVKVLSDGGWISGRSLARRQC